MEKGAPAATWSPWEAIGVYLLALVAAGLAAAPIVAGRVAPASSSGAGPVEIGASIVGDVVIFVALIAWLQVRHPNWRAAVRFPARSNIVRELGAGVAAGAILYPVIAVGVGSVITIAFRAAFGNRIEAPRQLSSHLSGTGIVLALILALVVAPIGEELFFRGILFRSIRDRYGFWPAAVGSAVAFGLGHYVPSPWQDALLLQTLMVFTGVGLAYIYDRRGNLVADIASHATFNMIGLVLILRLG